MNRDHLVVIDDDKSFRSYLTTLLEAIGYRVTCFASALPGKSYRAATL